jgi:hypothetical protein
MTQDSVVEDALKTLPDWLVKQAARESWEEAQKTIRNRQSVYKYARYADDPVGFGKNVLGESYTDGVIEVMNSVVNNPVTVVRSANAVGKTHCAARIAWWWFNVHEFSQVYMAAAPPFENLKKLLWGELMSIKRKHPGLFTPFKNKSMEIERYKEESFIVGVPIPTTGSVEQREAKFSGKHAPHLLFIVDEGDAVPGEVFRGIDSCMTGGHARLLIMFNPRAQQGETYVKEEKSLANVVHLSAFEHPNVITGRDIIPGAVTRNTVGRRINDWTRELMRGEERDESCFDVPDFIVGYEAQAQDGRTYPPIQPGVRKVTEIAFYYMVLGVYPPQGEFQLISSEHIDLARSRWDQYVSTHGRIPPFGIQPRIGADLAEYGVDVNVACARYGNFVDEFRTWNGVDVDMSTRMLLEICRELDSGLLLVDGTGIGAACAPSVVRLGREKHRLELAAMTVKVAERPSPVFTTEKGEFKLLRDRMWWMTREWLANENAMLPPDPMLIEELKCPTYTVKDGKIRVMDKDTMRKILKRSPDRAEALALTHVPFERAKIMRVGV